MGNILSLFIVIMAEQAGRIFGLSPNELLGTTSAITGIGMVLLVIPGGILADRWSREGVLRIAFFSGLISIFLLILGTGISFIIAGLFFWGVFQGLSRPAAEALLADSVPSGKRSGIYARVHLIQQFGMAVGPVLNIILFLFLGDRWDLGILKNVMIFGLCFSCSSCFVMLFLRQGKTIGKESESFQGNNTADPRFRKVPYLLLSANFIIGIGAGMTVKFFPVFFRTIYDLKPISVQMIMGGVFFVTGLTGLAAQKASLRRGRSEMIIAVQSLAIGCLFGIASYPALGLLVVLFICRGALMNAAQPLSRSILMDLVPKKKRGLWNSLETVAWGLFWNASAAAGGFLIGENNFRRCFLITAAIYVVGTIPIFFIISSVRGIDRNSSYPHPRRLVK